MVKIKLDEIEYKYTPVIDVINDPSILPHSNLYNKTKYLDLDCGFDIETSRINQHFSTMYMWQFSLNSEFVVIGRTWEHFIKFIEILGKHYHTNNDQRILVWIHNAPYEWCFVRKWLKFNINKYGKKDVFAISNREVIYFITDNFIEFRDSLILTGGRPLKDLPKTYGLNTKKLTEIGMNYNVIRHSKTSLTNIEFAYAINDVVILSEFNKKYIKRVFLSNKEKIPLTSTGIVRHELKKKYRLMNPKEKKKWKNKIIRAFPSYSMYDDLIRWLYRGGFVHASAIWVDEKIILNDMGSFDRKSSYPASILHELYPYRFCKKDKDWFNEFGFDRKKLKTTAYFGTFKFYNIRTKYTISFESQNKIYESSNARFDNGRLVSADYIIVCLTEQDILNYDDLMVWDKLECINIYVSDKEPLPKYVLDLTLEYFYLKETLEKDTPDYRIKKANLNSIYGMMVTALFNQSYICNENNDIILSDEITSFNKLIEKQILLPQHGIWITAYSRRELLKAFAKVKYDAIYGDTDSIKLVNVTGWDWYFKAYNDNMERINMNMYTGNYPKEIFKDLGKFMFESRMYFFKTLGAKRYMHSDVINGKLETIATISGCKKGSIQEYCEKNNLNPYDVFKDNMELSPEYSKKLTTYFNDLECSEVVKDVNGVEYECKELSSCTLNESPFSMKMDKEFIAYIKELNEQNKRKVGARIYG